MNYYHASLKPQTGAVLLALLLVVIVGSSFFLATKLNLNLARTQQDEQTGIALNAAKNALIGYAVSYPDKVNPNEARAIYPVLIRITMAMLREVAHLEVQIKL